MLEIFNYQTESSLNRIRQDRNRSRK